MDDRIEAYLAKAEESLAGAVSELANGRFNNAANRCYYSCFQAAIAALVAAGITSPDPTSQWSHQFVQAAFVGRLVNRQKLYPTSVRDTLSRTMAIRLDADYDWESVTQTEARRMVRRAQEFVEIVRSTIGADEQ